MQEWKDRAEKDKVMKIGVRGRRTAGGIVILPEILLPHFVLSTSRRSRSDAVMPEG